MTTLSITQSGIVQPPVIEHPLQRPVRPTAFAAARPSLRALLHELKQHLPSQMAVLGVCADQTPVLFDLTDPRPGSLLVCSDRAESNLSLLQTLLHSALTFSGPDEVQFLVLSNDPARWESFRKAGENTGHCLGVMGGYEDRAVQHLLDIADAAEQRRLGKAHGPDLLLIVDDLRWLAKMDFDVRLVFEWLLTVGPQVSVWPVAAVTSKDLTALGSLAHKFRTRVTGAIADSRLGCRAAGSDHLRSDELAPDEFTVNAGGEWLRFSTPTLD